MGIHMIGAIAGDIIGSVHEAEATKTKRFELFTADSRFTDDTVMTIAVAEVLLTRGDYVSMFHRYFDAYPDAGYGMQFLLWCAERRTRPYQSWGNGSAMRVSPVGWLAKSLDEALAEAERSARVTHDHPEGIRGAQAVAASVFLARQRPEKQVLANYITQTFGYQLDQPLDEVRHSFLFDVSCAGTVPWAVRAFLEARDYEDTVRNAVSLGGDADTLACIAGAIAEAYYGVPPEIVRETRDRLDADLLDVLDRFERAVK